MPYNFKRGTPSPNPTPNLPAKRGRPKGSGIVKYESVYANLAEKMVSRLGATDRDLAYTFGVSEMTINRWKHEHSEFGLALKQKVVADAEVAHSLYRSATGYSHPAVKFVVVNNEVQELHYLEHYPPNPTAMIFWLKNRQPGLWRDQRPNDDGSGGTPSNASGSVTKLESRVIDAEFRDITDAVLDAAGVAAAARRDPAPGDTPGLPTVVTTSPL